MEEVIKQIYNEKYPKIVSIESTKMILEQMKKSICKIYTKDGKKGTGFFCKIKYDNKDIKVMITNYHIINDKYIKENDRIETALNDDKENITIYLKNKKIYTNELYDITIIEIENEEINNFMNIDERYLKGSGVIFEKSIYII